IHYSPFAIRRPSPSAPAAKPTIRGDPGENAGRGSCLDGRAGPTHGCDDELPPTVLPFPQPTDPRLDESPPNDGVTPGSGLSSRQATNLLPDARNEAGPTLLPVLTRLAPASVIQ